MSKIPNPPNFIVSDPNLLDLVTLSHELPTLVDHARRNRPLYRSLVVCTNFLPSTANAKQRLWHIEHQTLDNPKCCQCKVKDVSWVNLNNSYNRFCTSKCAHASDEVRSKIKQTNIEKYGVEWNITSKQSVDKRDLTCMEKYGHKNPRKNQEVKNKIQQTIKSMYGENRELILQKTKQIWLEKYGVDHPWKITSIRQLCVDNRGPILEPHIQRRMDDNQWLMDQHVVQQKPIYVIAEELGIAASTVGRYIHIHNIPVQTLATSQYEKQVVEFLTNININIETSNRQIIPPYEVDVLLPQFDLAIEINGVFFHSELKGRGPTYHLHKTQECQKRNIQLIHILDSELILQREIVFSKIASKIGQTVRVGARKTRVVQLDSKIKKQFFDDNHIQGDAKSSVCYGLINIDGNLLMAASFGKPRFTKNTQWELIRLCSILNHTVVGGASKLLTYFKQINKPASIISYCDKRWSDGEVYTKTGFAYSHDSPPNYHYFKKNKPTILLPRSQFQKHKLDKLLPIFDPQQTEWENMQANGYDRIWDCGNKVWVWNS